jgi:hypothetical protein
MGSIGFQVSNNQEKEAINDRHYQKVRKFSRGNGSRKDWTKPEYFPQVNTFVKSERKLYFGPRKTLKTVNANNMVYAWYSLIGNYEH